MKSQILSFLVLVLLALAASGCGSGELAPEGCSLGDTLVRPADGAVMVCVPSGEFQMGSSDADVDAALELCNQYFGNCERAWFENELPLHTVALDGFWMDRAEVTNGQYAQCVVAGACEPPPESISFFRDSYYGDSGYDDYPVIWVNWYQAETYCTWAGARLPTEAEWEYAARGPERLVYPWGNTFDGTRLNYCDTNCHLPASDAAYDDGYADTAPVESYPSGASWVGALDMAGNVWEWVADRYGEYPSGRQENPTGPASEKHQVLRGGSWDMYRGLARCAFRYWADPDSYNYNSGFRCVSPVSGPGF